MVTIGMNYAIIPGCDDEFTSVFDKVMKLMADIDGHTKTNLYRDVWSEHDYLVVSEWASQEAFDAFIASDRFKNVADWGKKNVLRTRPTHEVYAQAPTTPAQATGCPAAA